MAGRFVACAAFLLLASSALATDIQLKPILPTTVKIQSSTYVGEAVIVTPPSPGRRRLGEVADLPLSAEFTEEDMHGPSRRLQQGHHHNQTFQTYGPHAADILALLAEFVPAFVEEILAALANDTMAGRKMLQDSSGQLTFYGLVKENPATGIVTATYVFNEDSAPYLKIVTQSGTGYKFKRGVLLLPEEGTDSNTPPYSISETGFLSDDPFLKPTFARVQTQETFDKVPDVGIRFDYEAVPLSSSPDLPRWSIYLTDYKKFLNPYPYGIPESNIMQSAGFYLGDKKVFQSQDQKKK